MGKKKNKSKKNRNKQNGFDIPLLKEMSAEDMNNDEPYEDGHYEPHPTYYKNHFEEGLSVPEPSAEDMDNDEPYEDGYYEPHPTYYKNHFEEGMSVPEPSAEDMNNDEPYEDGHYEPHPTYYKNHFEEGMSVPEPSAEDMDNDELSESKGSEWQSNRIRNNELTAEKKKRKTKSGKIIKEKKAPTKQKKLFKETDEEYTKYFKLSEECELLYKKDEKENLVANFILEPLYIERHLTETGHKESLILRGWYKNQPLKEVRVNVEELQNSRWLDHHFGFHFALAPERKSYDLLRYYLKLRSNSLKEKIIVREIGWHCIDGKWHYMDGSGSLTADTNIEVSSECNHLKLKINKKLDERFAYRKSLEMLDVANNCITIPLFANTILSTMNTFLRNVDCEPCHVIWLHGETGTRKTTLAGLFANVFSKQVPASFKDTKTITEIRMNEYRDATLIVDDFHPSQNPREKLEMEDKSSFILRLIGDRISKGRSNTNLEKRDYLVPKCGLVITGEDITGVASDLARSIAIEISHNDIDLDKLTEIQQIPSLMPTALLHYIRFLGDCINKNPKFFSKTEKNLANFRRDYHSNVHGRLVKAQFFLTFAFHNYIGYGVNIGAISKEEANMYLDKCDEVLDFIVKRQGLDMLVESPVTLYLKILNELIESKTLQVKKLDKEPNGITHGYEDELYYYLFGELCFSEVQKFYRKMGKVFPIGRVKLNKMLKDRGIIKTDSDRNSPKKQLPSGKRERLLTINKDMMSKHI